MKYKISKGSIQETLLIPLYGRKMAMDLYPDLFADADCQSLFDRIDFEKPKMSAIKAKIGAIMAATRQQDMAAAWAVPLWVCWCREGTSTLTMPSWEAPTWIRTSPGGQS